jgi:hypothetical protein
MGVFGFTLLNRGGRINVRGVVGYTGRRIVLILLRQPPPTPIPTNLAPIAKHMAMMQTIISPFI